MTAEVPLRDGTTRELTMEAVERAASEAPTASGAVRSVEVSGVEYDLLPLFERALEVSTGDLTYPAAISAAIDIGLLSDVPQDQGLVTPGNSPTLRSRLYRLRGNWVAVNDETLLAHNSDLVALMAAVADREATIFFVPVDERWSR